MQDADVPGVREDTVSTVTEEKTNMNSRLKMWRIHPVDSESAPYRQRG